MDDRIRATVEDQPVCRLVRPDDAEALGRLFERLRLHGAETLFHPHPLTREAAVQRAAYAGKDLYCVLQIGAELVGYGILRGWDEGFDVPSLGIGIDPAHQGKGEGRRLMEFLHALARRRGAKRVRLRVYPENVRAVKLYRSLGYTFQEARGADGQIVGSLELDAAKPPKSGGLPA